MSDAGLLVPQAGFGEGGWGAALITFALSGGGGDSLFSARPCWGAGAHY